MHRKIIHIDMDAFFASVEQRDFPELKGKPVAVGGSKERGVVAAASYEARKFGVKSAMSSKMAFLKCPDIIFVKPRFEAYKKVSEQIHEIFSRYTDLIEPLSLDEAFLDVTSNKQGIESATEIAFLIKEAIKNELDLIASAGVSINKFLAKIASDMDKPDGLYVIPPDKIDAFLPLLEVRKIFGVGKVTAEKMTKHGIVFVRDLRRFKEDDLIRLFGKSGGHFYRLARGIDNRPVNPFRERKSVGAEHTLSKNVYNQSDLFEAIEGVMQSFQKRFEKVDVSAYTLTIKLKFGDFTQVTRSRTTEEPLTIMQIKKIIPQLIKEIDVPEVGVRLVGVSVSNFNRVIETEEVHQQLTLKF